MPGDNQTLTALIALLLWPIVSVVVFSTVRPFSRALIWSVLLAQLLLPAGTSFKLQMLPQIDKASVSNFCAFLCCLIFAETSRRPPFRIGLIEVLVAIYVTAPFVTAVLNPDNIIIGGSFLPGVGLYDGASAAQGALIALIPFLLGRRYLRSAEDSQRILVCLVLAGLAYSIPMLFEIRFSPQLHYWVYGYYPGEFVQTMRGEGFRPMVFTGHGLAAAFFMMSACLAAAALLRNRLSILPIPPVAQFVYLEIILVLCKSLGSLVYGIVGPVLIMFCRPKTQIAFACVLTGIALAYPVLRTSELFPTTTVLNVAEVASRERMESLKFRFDNEDRLLKRAMERPLFGWGRFGRSRVYDPESGKDISVTDGRWIIDIGQSGLVGFGAEFGLLAAAVFAAWRAFRKLRDPRLQICFSTLSLIVGFNNIDLLPNAGLIPWMWLLTGSLLGQAESLLRKRQSRPVTRAAPEGATLGMYQPSITKS